MVLPDYLNPKYNTATQRLIEYHSKKIPDGGDPFTLVQIADAYKIPLLNVRTWFYRKILKPEYCFYNSLEETRLKQNVDQNGKLVGAPTRYGFSPEHVAEVIRKMVGLTPQLIEYGLSVGILHGKDNTIYYEWKEKGLVDSDSTSLINEDNEPASKEEIKKFIAFYEENPEIKTFHTEKVGEGKYFYSIREDEVSRDYSSTVNDKEENITIQDSYLKRIEDVRRYDLCFYGVNDLKYK